MDTAASAGFSFQSNGQSQGNQGFAIPINTALSIARRSRPATGSSTVHIGTTAFLGVEISPSGSSSSSGYSGSPGTVTVGGFGGLFGNSGSTGNTGNTGVGSSSSGAAVAGVVTNGPAQEAGLAQGDVITSLGGKTINSANDLTNDHEHLPPGRQGAGRLDRRQRADAHGDGAAELGAAAVGAAPSSIDTSTSRLSPVRGRRFVQRSSGLDQPGEGDHAGQKATDRRAESGQRRRSRSRGPMPQLIFCTTLHHEVDGEAKRGEAGQPA